MLTGSPTFLVDTNVLLYALDPRVPDKQERAIAVLDRLGTQTTGAVSVQILGEFFVNATRKMPQPLSGEEAEEVLTGFARAWYVYALTPVIVLEAVRGVRRHQFSYWDAVVWATAKMNSVPTILSEDSHDGRLIEGVRYINPFAPPFDLAVLTREPT